MKFRLTILWPALLAGASLASADEQAQPAKRANSPLSAEASLQHFELLPGLKMELVAAEPEVVDPIEIRFDQRGRMWVVEMRDYPEGPVAGGAPQSRIRVLEDRDRDGRYETATTFVDGLVFPTGLQHWRGGVFVTLAGEIVYFVDDDGDLKADGRETWYTGFTQENQQLRANHPRLSADGWIYVAGGLRGGSIRSARDPDAEPIDIRGRDFRFHPQTGAAEAIAGNSQFGMCLDPLGNRFVVDNRHPLRQVMIEEHYLKRSPQLAFPALVHDVMKAGEESTVHPIAPAWTTSNLHAGQFTACCSPLLYQGELLPEAYREIALVCEPTGSLVHAEQIKLLGGTFTATPLSKRQEFLASPDPWFRPVNLEIGPDGAIYVVDMYRAVIEHPQWMPDELKKRPDLRDGDDRGRIYRIVSTAPANAIPLAAREEPELHDLWPFLYNPHAWNRDTAVRLMLEGHFDRPTSRDQLVIRLAKNRNPADAATALIVLDSFGELDESMLLEAIYDQRPAVRQVACRLAAPKLAASDKLRAALIDICRRGDGDDLPAVLALAGHEASDEVLAALAVQALKGADDVWMRRAIATAAAARSTELLVGVLGTAQPGEHDTGLRSLMLELGELAGAQLDREGSVALFSFAKTAFEQKPPSMLVAAALLGFGDGVARRGQRLTVWLAQGEKDEATKTVVAAATAWFEHAARIAADRSASQADRQLALRLLAHAPSSIGVGPLLAIAADPSESALQTAALNSLRRHDDAKIAPEVLDAYAEQSPTIRRAMLDLLIASPGGAPALVAAIQSQRISAAEVDVVRRQALVRHRDPKVKTAATQLWQSPPREDRQQLFKQYAAVLASGDPRRGHAIYQKNCATCHRIGSEGFPVGPDISDSRTKKPEQLLLDILEPSAAIDAAFTSYIAVGSDGSIQTGVVTSETAASITLQQPEGKSVILLRSEIDELSVSPTSLMPEGIERTIQPQEMADLISFVKSWRYLDGSVPAAR